MAAADQAAAPAAADCRSHERVDALLPAADLPDLVLEIAAKTGFIDAFTNDQEPGAQLEGLATSLCAVLVAQACNVGYTCSGCSATSRLADAGGATFWRINPTDYAPQRARAPPGQHAPVGVAAAARRIT